MCLLRTGASNPSLSASPGKSLSGSRVTPSMCSSVSKYPRMGRMHVAGVVLMSFTSSVRASMQSTVGKSGTFPGTEV